MREPTSKGGRKGEKKGGEKKVGRGREKGRGERGEEEKRRVRPPPNEKPAYATEMISDKR